MTQDESPVYLLHLPPCERPRVKEELRRLGIDSSKMLSFQTIDIELLKQSSLLDEQGLFALINRLFSFESPHIDLGNGLVFRRELGPYFCQDRVYLKCPGSSSYSDVFQVTKNDDRAESRGVSWFHRTDKTALDMAIMLAEKYKELHTNILDRDTEFKKGFGKSGGKLQMTLITGDFEYFPEVNTLREHKYDFPVSAERIGLLMTSFMPEFYGLIFHGGALNCGLSGKAEYLHYMKYKPGEGMIHVLLPRGFPARDYVEEWVFNLIRETSFLCDPKYKHLAANLNQILPSYLMLAHRSALPDAPKRLIIP